MHNSSIDSLRAEADEPLNKSSRPKRIIFIIIRTLVTIALIYWILKDTNFNKIIKSISVADFMLVTLAFFLHFVLAGMGCVLFTIFFPPKKITSLITKIRIPFSGKLQQIAEKIINAFLVFKGKKRS